MRREPRRRAALLAARCRRPRSARRSRTRTSAVRTTWTRPSSSACAAATLDAATPSAPTEEAVQSAAASRRLDDAFRSFLAERGAKPVPLAEVTSLVTGAAALRLDRRRRPRSVAARRARGGGRPQRGACGAAPDQPPHHGAGTTDLAGSLADRNDVPAPLAQDVGANGRFVDAVRHDLVGRDGKATATAVRMIWTGDHLDAARRLQASSASLRTPRPRRMRSACSRGCVRGGHEDGRCRRLRRGNRRPRSGAGTRGPRRRRSRSGHPRGRPPAVGTTRRRLAELRRARLRGSGQRVRSPHTSCGSPGPTGSRSSCRGGARRTGRRKRSRRDLSASPPDAARIAGGAGAGGSTAPARRRQVCRARRSRRGGARRHPSAADARFHGRSQLRRVHRSAAIRCRRALPGDVDAILGRAGGAAGGVRRRVLPPRLGSLRRTLAQHRRGIVDVDRRARRLPRRSRAARGPRRHGRTGR